MGPDTWLFSPLVDCDGVTEDHTSGEQWRWETLYLSHSVSHPEGLKEDGIRGKSLIHLFAISWTVALQALLSM